MSYGVHVYAAEGDPGFLQATSLYHPDTVERSLKMMVQELSPA
ncbi:MAG: hypothetical protein QM621_04555 [Aeromicrobium sp.]